MTTTDPATRPSLNALIAAEIRAEMGRQGMVMARLAELLGASEAWTSRRLSARYSVQPLTFAELERIAAVLGRSPLDLIPKRFTPQRCAVRAAIESLTFDQLEDIAGALGVSHLDLIPKDSAPKVGRNPPATDVHAHRPRPITSPRPHPSPKPSRTRHAPITA